MANQRVDRESYWHEIMEDWSESDLSLRRFCGARKLGYSAFSYWRRRLAKLDGSRGASKKADGPSIHPFIPVEVKPSGPAGSRLSYEVTLESGCRISVPFHFETGITGAVDRSLGGPPLPDRSGSRRSFG